MQSLKDFLDVKVAQYNQPGFIANDPVSIPHRFSKKQDIEIAGFFAAILAWGQRKTIINKCLELFKLMDDAPHDFLLNHHEADLKRFSSFKHRTFNEIDTLYFIHFLSRNKGLEAVSHIISCFFNIRNFGRIPVSLPWFHTGKA